MDHKLIKKIERLLSFIILPFKREHYRKLQEQARVLNEHGAPAEEKKALQRELRGYRNRIYSLERERGRNEPPTLGDVILNLLPIKNRECVIGDLMEDYEKMVAWRGKRYADWWFYGQVLRSMWPLIKTTLFCLIWAYIRRRI